MSNNSRKNLHDSIWNIADKLRGTMDGWEFKNYILIGIFYRFISEDFAHFVNEWEKKVGSSFSGYENLSLEEQKEKIENNKKFQEDCLQEKGFYIYPGNLFVNVLQKGKNDPDNLNKYLSEAFNQINNSTIGSPSEQDFEGLFKEFDINNEKLDGDVPVRNQILLGILEGIQNMNLGGFQNSDIDIFGDAYEYLMKMYASNAGKSGGEFFTPQEVSELLAKITTSQVSKKNLKVYDMCVGSGSLLLKVIKIFGRKNIQFYGQEINPTTFNLCRINMFLHNIPCKNFKIAKGDTLLRPSEEIEQETPFDIIVSNPPYSLKWKGVDEPGIIDDKRFIKAGALAPKSKADLAFVLHALHYLAQDGIAAIVCFPGVFYRMGAERKIRKYLVEEGYVDALIELPENLFFGTSIATSIIVLKKNRMGKDNLKTLFIDASEQFLKVSNNNQLSEENINFIVDIYKNRKEVEFIARLVSVEEIEKNDYNLSVKTYVKKPDTEEKIDIKKLNSEIEEIVLKQSQLREEIDKIINQISEN